MSICKNRAWDTLTRLSFERISGSDKELEAAKLLQEECRKAGVEATIESFEIAAPQVHEVKLEIIKPEIQEFYCTGIGKSGTTPDEGICGPLVYIHAGEDENITDVKGKIVMSTGGMSSDLRKKLVAKGAIGYITTWGGFYDDEIMKTQVPHRNATIAKDDDSNFPGVLMNLYTAEQLLKAKPEEVRIILKQDKDTKGESRNVVATIEGTDLKDEIVVFSAHYDSVEFSSGAWDNATGSITILELLHYFQENRPSRTVKFVWCGSEEIGLCGSYAFCEAHKEDLDKIILNINFDMTGVLMGCDMIYGSVDKSIIDRAAYLAKVDGHALTVGGMGLMPSDSTSFALHEVPALSFGTRTPRGGAEIHSRRDTMEHLDADKFIGLCEFVAKFSSEIINAKVNVVPRQLPKEVKDQEESMRKRLGYEK